MSGPMVVLIPRSNVTRVSAAGLARALDGIRLVLVERSLSADVCRFDAARLKTAAEDEAHEIARQLAADNPPGPGPARVVIVGQGDGAAVAVELARCLERAREGNPGRAASRVRGVVVAAALPSLADRCEQVEPIDAALHVWAGCDDLFAPPGSMRMLAWREHTNATTTFRAFDGSEDFLFSRAKEVADRLRRVLTAHGETEALDVR